VKLEREKLKHKLKFCGSKKDSVSFARIVDDKLRSIEPKLTFSTRTKALLADIRQLRFQGLVESKELEEYKTEFERTRDGFKCFLDDPTVISSQKKRGKASMRLARFCDEEIQRGALNHVRPSLLALHKSPVPSREPAILLNSDLSPELLAELAGGVQDYVC
jgi:hypothetical protein